MPPPSTSESSKSLSRAVKIPTRMSRSNPNPLSLAHPQQHPLKTTMLNADQSSFSSSSMASSSSSSGFYDSSGYGPSPTSTSAYPVTSPTPISRATYSSFADCSFGSSLSDRKMKSKAVDFDSAPSSPPPSSSSPILPPRSSPLGPAMQSSQIYRSVNLNGPGEHLDDPPRLITFTRSGQGFTWNEELFLPSYMIGRYSGRGRRKQYDGDLGDDDIADVAEIFVTDEEAASMLP